jgi:hypothetical protein
MADLQTRRATAALALELAILTAAPLAYSIPSHVKGRMASSKEISFDFANESRLRFCSGVGSKPSLALNARTASLT